MTLRSKTAILGLTLSLFLGSAQITQAQNAVTAPAPAEQEVTFSKAQLTKFVNVGQKMQTVQEGMAEEIRAMAEKEGLDQATFEKMSASKMQGGDLSGYTPEQQAAFSKVQGEAMKMQQTLMTKIASITEEEGMDMGTFRQIAMASRSDEALQKRIQAITESMAEE